MAIKIIIKEGKNKKLKSSNNLRTLKEGDASINDRKHRHGRLLNPNFKSLDDGEFRSKGYGRHYLIGASAEVYYPGSSSLYKKEQINFNFELGDFTDNPPESEETKINIEIINMVPIACFENEKQMALYAQETSQNAQQQQEWFRAYKQNPCEFEEFIRGFRTKQEDFNPHAILEEIKSVSGPGRLVTCDFYGRREIGTFNGTDQPQYQDLVIVFTSLDGGDIEMYTSTEM